MTVLVSSGLICASAASQVSDSVISAGFFNVFEGQLTAGCDMGRPQLGPLSSSSLVLTCTYLSCLSKRLARVYS